MPIICGTNSRTTDALAAAEALNHQLRLGNIVTIDLDRADNPAGAVIDAARARGAELVVLATHTHRDDIVMRVAHDSDAPVLVVRHALPIVEWAARRRPLRVVLGWDDSTTTLAALDHVMALRAAAPLDLEIVYVYFPDEAARRYGTRVTSMVDPDPEIEQLLRRDITHELGDRITGEGSLSVVPLRGIGHVGEHLLDHVRSVSADVLVAGTHHRHGLRRLSSVAERILANGDGTSLLLVPRRPTLHASVAPPVQVAVVATDGSTFANAAIPYAYRLVPDTGEVHLVRVVDSSERVDDAAMIESLMALRPHARTTRTVPHVVRDRDPAHAIAVAAEQVGADVVCIASHGRTGIARAVKGSVTDRLLHVCRRPVLVLHPVE